jgi:hypothetical protein
VLLWYLGSTVLYVIGLGHGVVCDSLFHDGTAEGATTMIIHIDAVPLVGRACFLPVSDASETK